MYKEVVSPLLDRLDSEKMHVAARETLYWAEKLPFGLAIAERFAYHQERFTDQKLHVNLGGIEFDTPVMLGGGWDKLGKTVKAWHKLGASGVEVGSVLAYPQPGNDKKRQFMIGPGVALNRLGFNSPGMYEVAKNLERYNNDSIPIGISVGLNKLIPQIAAPEMHAHVIHELYPYASYFAINVSSPNTPGLRALQDKGPLTDIVQAVNGQMDKLGERKPVFIKIAPDLPTEDVDDVIEVVLDNRLTGIIATNTTNNVDIKAKYGYGDQAGGLSGNDEEYRKMATETVRHIYKITNGGLEIIGVGGVNSAQTALEKIQAGARVVQVVTGIREVGPTLPGRINRGLVDWMDNHGIKHLNEIIGSEAV